MVSAGREVSAIMSKQRANWDDLRIILIILTVVRVVEVVGLVLNLLSHSVFPDPVLALGFSELVNFTTSKASDHFFGKLVGDWLA